MNVGVVIGIDRANHVCAVQLQGGPTVTASYMNSEPPPRSIVWLQDLGSGSWVVLGSKTSRRLVFHEDFCILESSNTNNTRIGADTEWWSNVSGAASAAGGSFIGTGDTQRVGQVSCVTAASGGSYMFIGKDPNGGMRSPITGALWVSCRVAISNLTSTVYQGGLGTFSHFIGGGAAAFGVSWRRDPAVFAGRWQFWTSNAGVYTQVDTGITTTAGQWMDLDLLYVPGGWVAFWVNGIYSGKLTTNLPPVNSQMQAAFVTFASIATAAVSDTDFFRVEHLAPINTIVSP